SESAFQPIQNGLTGCFKKMVTNDDFVTSFSQGNGHEAMVVSLGHQRHAKLRRNLIDTGSEQNSISERFRSCDRPAGQFPGSATEWCSLDTLQRFLRRE